MKKIKTERVIAAITVLFIIFTGGYFLGRKSSVNVITAPSVYSTDAPRAETENPRVSETVGVPFALETPPGNGISGETEPASYDIININTASRAELTDLPGIGDTLAERIIQYRETTGSFKTIEEIMNVSGIGEKRFEAIREYITV